MYLYFDCVQIINEVLMYHNQPTSEEVTQIMNDGIPDHQANRDISTQM